MASYPTSVKSFTTKNTADTVQASHVNDLQDEVNALEDGLRNATAPLNSSNSTLANLSVGGGSTVSGLTVSSNLTVSGASTVGSLTISSGGLVGLSSNQQVELGSLTSTGTPFIDFHTSGNNIDYDVRILARGGSTAVGRGELQLSAVSIFLLSQGLPSTTTAPYFRIGNSTTSSGAAATLQLANRAGTVYALWVDATGDLRVGTSAPTADETVNDTSGTVVGTQS